MHAHNAGSTGTELQICLLWMQKPALPTPVLLGGSPVVVRTRKDMLLGHMPLIPVMVSSPQASALFLEHPETGSHCLPLIPTALSLNLLHPENLMWISQEPDQEWAGAHSILGVLMGCLPSSLPIREARASSQEEQSR